MYILISLSMVATPDFTWTIYSLHEELSTCVEEQTEEKFCIHAGRAYYIFDPEKPIRKDRK